MRDVIQSRSLMAWLGMSYAIDDARLRCAQAATATINNNNDDDEG
jgi:hypothetical protein